MNRIFAIFIGIILALAVVCATGSRIQMEKSIAFKQSLRNWIIEKSKPLTDSEIVNCIFVIKRDENAVNKFEAELLELSTPSNPRYGKWLSPDEINARIAPSENSVKIVLDFLASQGVEKSNIRVSKFNDKVHVKMPVKLAATVLDTEFARFRSLQDRSLSLLRITKPYSLPSEVASVVNLVDDILRLPALRDAPIAYGASDAAADPAFSTCGTKCAGNTNPQVLKTAYSFPTPVASVAKGNSVSVAEFQYQYYDTADLKNFDSACGTTVAVSQTIGGNKEAICEAGGCVEALLDIEYIGAVTYPIPLTVIYQATYSILDWIDSVISMSNPPLVHSVSYGNDEVQQTSVEYMNSVNQQFMIAGSMGLSVLFASGDQGVWGRSGVGKTFHPDFPASSPYVTAVGGTNFATSGVIGKESAWSCGGGGFSDTFPAPSWQTSAVSSYLKTASAKGVLPGSTFFNASGRAYPDVSALGGQTNPYCVSVSGGTKLAGVAGTSASCPVVAGIFSQLNNVRLNLGKSPLGWLNPLIYANGQCFNDINDGSQNNCNAGTTGFSTITGWDAATGFGSPNFACLQTVVAKLN